MRANTHKSRSLTRGAESTRRVSPEETEHNLSRILVYLPFLSASGTAPDDRHLLRGVSGIQFEYQTVDTQHSLVVLSIRLG
jgi:hypothetical protein